MQIEVALANIVSQTDIDAIVNSANANLRFGSGVTGAIHTAAGPELERYCRQFSPLDLGNGVITPGFNLPVRSIIHVRAASYVNDDHAEKYLEMAVLSALRLARTHQIRRLAMPAIGTGVFKFPPELAARLMVTALTTGHRDSEYPQHVRICVASIAMETVFLSALGNAASSDPA